jgi:hypothetical protein
VRSPSEEELLRVHPKGINSTVNVNILDPDIDDSERQRRYEEFKYLHLLRIDKYVKAHKKKHRIENPDDYNSDDSVSSMFDEGEPWRMFGRLAKDKQTGQSYKIPSLARVNEILLNSQKNTEEIVDILFPKDVDIKDQMCALTIM